MKEKFNSYPKKLASGIYVDSDTYYALLVWKNKHMTEFIEWAYENKLKVKSINGMSKKEFDKCVKFSGITQPIKP